MVDADMVTGVGLVVVEGDVVTGDGGITDGSSAGGWSCWDLCRRQVLRYFEVLL